ncbi:class I SAM-dependent methyltransferase [Chitinophaga vietnamensis]|uniref:class I SAM-dependent methyltransferase n=1 Tax=Chitinophaga vietnamensis TaxID=2593957 RepID=UPI0011776FCF|nr:class I SAM-dependent methyltransferase [Chitinophaga vietnamensis]
MKKTTDAYQRAAMPSGAVAVLETRTLENSNANLLAVLQPGQSVLDVGCGSGAITRGIVPYVGAQGFVMGIDRSAELIQLAQELSGPATNLSFAVADVLDFQPGRTFDVITIARTLQWIEAPEQVLQRLITLLRPGGVICVLDYNHLLLEWQPQAPAAMQHFYDAFLKWRADAHMDNAIGDHVADLFHRLHASTVTVTPQHEYVEKGMPGFETHIGIWQKVAETRGVQLVQDGYITEEERQAAIAAYAQWIRDTAQSMRLHVVATHATFG